MGNFNDFMHDNYNRSIYGGLQQVPIDIQKAIKNTKKGKEIVSTKKNLFNLTLEISTLPTTLISKLMENIFNKLSNLFKNRKKPQVKTSTIEEIHVASKSKKESSVIPESSFNKVDDIDKNINAKCGLLDLESNTWRNIDTARHINVDTTRYPVNENILRNRLVTHAVVKLYEKINHPDFEYLGDSRIDRYPIYAYKGHNFLSHDLIYEEVVSI